MLCIAVSESFAHRRVLRWAVYLWTSLAIFKGESGTGEHRYASVLTTAVAVTCQSQGSHTLNCTLSYCPFYSKWNHDLNMWTSCCIEEDLKLAIETINPLVNCLLRSYIKWEVGQISHMLTYNLAFCNQLRFPHGAGCCSLTNDAMFPSCSRNSKLTNFSFSNKPSSPQL